MSNMNHITISVKMQLLRWLSRSRPTEPPSDSNTSNSSMENTESHLPETTAPEISPFLRLPAEIRNIIYGYVLAGTERPLFFVEKNEIWRCGPSSAFTRPGPPSLLRVNRSIAEGAAYILHEVRELRLAIISQGFPTGKIDCYHRVGRLENFASVLERIQTLTLDVHVHPGHRIDEPFLMLLDWICSLLEKRSVPIRHLGLVLTCCYGDNRRLCKEDTYDLARRFQELQPTFVEHSPWNGKCLWSKVKQTKGRYKRAAVESEKDASANMITLRSGEVCMTRTFVLPRAGASLAEGYSESSMYLYHS